jgi:hypothetical protein
MEGFKFIKEMFEGSFGFLHSKWSKKIRTEIGAALSGASAFFITHHFLPLIKPLGPYLAGTSTDIVAARHGYKIFKEGKM